MTTLPNGYDLRVVDMLPPDEYGRLVDEILKADSGYVDVSAALPEERRAQIAAAREGRASPFGIRVGVWHDGALVAWSYAHALNPRQLMMATSGVAAPHRRRGLYRAMLERMLAEARAEGFEEVASCHVATNNPILIAKLSAGFFVVGTEVHAEVGLLVRLCCPLDPERRRVYEVRSGARPHADLPEPRR